MAQASAHTETPFAPRNARERAERIECARLAAADGCEASARELEHLTSYDPRMDDASFLSLAKGLRAFRRAGL